MSEDTKTHMGFWLPKIIAAGLPVPTTIMLTMPDDAVQDLWRTFDQLPPEGAWPAFVEAAKIEADKIGYPLFLRSAYTSGKHEWDRTCMTREREQFLFGPFLGDVISNSIPYNIQRRRNRMKRLGIWLGVLFVVTGAIAGLPGAREFIERTFL